MKNARIGSIHLIALTLLVAGAGLVGIVRDDDSNDVIHVIDTVVMPN